MGIFGTSKQEEEQLREAATNAGASSQNNSRFSFSSATGSSAYETAEEDFSELDAVSKEEEPQKFDHVEPQIDEVAADADTTAGYDDDETIKDSSKEVSSPKFGTSKDVDTPKDGMSSHHDIETEDDHSVTGYVPPQQTAGETKDNIEEEEDEENRLNRQYTLERLASRKSIAEVVEDEFQTFLSKQPSQVGATPSSKEEGEQQAIDVKDLDWDSETDPANPQNWPKWKKWIITITVAVVCLCCSLGSSLYVSGAFQIVAEFDVSLELTISGLTYYLLGLAFGPLLTAPLSEIIGRKIIYVVSLPTGMLFVMGVGLAKNIHTILVLRFFCGLFTSPALSVAGGTISDLWSDRIEELSQAVALFCLAPFLGPVLGPVIGDFAAEAKGWKWSASWILLMFCGAILPFVLICPETFKPQILKTRAKKRGIKIIERNITVKLLVTILINDLTRPLEMLIKEPIVLVLSIYIAFVFAVLFGFFEAFPIIFRGVYHMDSGVSGLPFLAVGLGLVSGVLFYLILDKTYYFPKNPDGTRGKKDENGNPIWDAPEKKLLLGKIGGICLPISLFWMGWTGRNDSVHWMAPTAAGFPFGFGMIMVFFSIVLYFSMCFPPIYVASAVAANNLLRYILASVFPLFTTQMYERLTISWASSLFGFIALAMVPVPFIFEKYGPKFRARSPYGYAAFFKKIAAAKAAAASQAASQAASKSSPSTAPALDKLENGSDSSGTDGVDVTTEKIADKSEEAVANKV